MQSDNGHMQSASDQSMLQAIGAGDVAGLRRFRAAYFEMVAQLVRRGGGTRDDAEDIFQEATLVIYERLKDSPLRLSSSLKTYLFAICRNLWSNVARKRQRLVAINDDQDNLANIGADESDILEFMQRREEYRIYREHFDRLSPQCRRVLSFFFAGVSMNAIAKEMNFSSAQYAKNVKCKCKQRLTQAIKADERFNELSER